MGLLPECVEVGVRPGGDDLVHPSGHAEAAVHERPRVVGAEDVEFGDLHAGHPSTATGNVALLRSVDYYCGCRRHIADRPTP